MASVNIWVGRDGRTPIVGLSVSGFENVAAAKAGIVVHLCSEGVDSDETGAVTLVTETETAIDVETERCGFGISIDDIAMAIAADGRSVYC